MQRCDEWVEVEARWEADGSVTPIRFTVGGQPHRVTSVGRNWDVAGEGRNILVMDERRQVYELVLRVPELRWWLAAQADRRDSMA